MFVHHSAEGKVLVPALFASGLLFVEDLPDIAAQWLTGGMDSSSLRILAGANNDDREDIRTWWTAAVQELGTDVGPAKHRWALIWGYELAAWTAGLRTSKELLRDAVAYLRADNYADRGADEAWVLYSHWDEVTSYYQPVRTEEEIWAEVDGYLRSFS